MRTASESLDILVTFLLIMALLTASVGSMGLAGAMGMNVLERTREIGIMRSIGATDREILRLVVVEGGVIGSLSWILAVLLSFPITYLLSSILSLAIFRSPIDVKFTLDDLYIKGDKIVWIFTMSGTITGAFRTPLGEVPPSGKADRKHKLPVSLALPQPRFDALGFLQVLIRCFMSTSPNPAIFSGWGTA